MNKLSLIECEKLAQEQGYDTATFDLCGPSGRKKCKWEDAYIGVLKVDGDIVLVDNHFYKLVNDLRLWCENFQTVNQE